MKKLLISAGSAAGLLLISLAAFLYPTGAVPEKEPVAEVTPSPQPTEMGVLPTRVPATPKPTKKPYMFSDKNAYLLVKIAMAEAEDEDTEGKALVMRVVLNRVKSREFPDSIKKVIYQERQFSPIVNGRFDRVEPNKDCQKALDMIAEDGWDESRGALYFESKSASTWHEDNLQFLFRHGNHFFYTDREEDSD